MSTTSLRTASTSPSNQQPDHHDANDDDDRAISTGAATATAWLRPAGLPEPTEPTDPVPPQSLLRPGKVLEGTLRGFAGCGRVVVDGTQHVVLARVEVFGRPTDITLDAAWFRFDDDDHA